MPSHTLTVAASVMPIGSQTERIDTTLQNHRAKIPITFYVDVYLYRRENYDLRRENFEDPM